MFTRIIFLTAASMMFLTSWASAEGVVAGRVAEFSPVSQRLLGDSRYVTTRLNATDSRILKITPDEANFLTAIQLVLPNAVIVLNAKDVTSGRGAALAPATLMIAKPSVPTSEPAPVIVIGNNSAFDAGTTANMYAATVVPAATLQRGEAVVVAGAEPVTREEGYYVRGESDRTMAQTIRLTNGRWVTIKDRLMRETGTIEGPVDFDPAALQPGNNVSLIKREDGTYFLSAAPTPRPRLVDAASGTVTNVNPRAGVLEMSDGSLVHPKPATGTVLAVRDQAIASAKMENGAWIVIDPNPTVALEAPSALPADVVISGRIWDVR